MKNLKFRFFFFSGRGDKIIKNKTISELNELFYQPWKEIMNFSCIFLIFKGMKLKTKRNTKQFITVITPHQNKKKILFLPGHLYNSLNPFSFGSNFVHIFFKIRHFLKTRSSLTAENRFTEQKQNFKRRKQLFRKKKKI